MQMSRSFCFLLMVLAYSAARAQSPQEIEVPEAQVNAEWFKACVTDWDSATHMTKNEWAATCRRLSAEPAERGDFSKDSDFELVEGLRARELVAIFPRYLDEEKAPTAIEAVRRRPNGADRQ